MFTRAFWKATGERAVRTAAGVLVASLGLDKVGIVDAPWADGLSLAAGSAVMTVLIALAVGNADGPGLTEDVKGRKG
ncbi:holin [Streptomyces sp. TRM68367]|uniref:holin n=1 Tax=Streptomyces sp. TRM68367 TaxID=2758415 RepID=UPI00165A7E2E|nr:holin [Streptomyces sp. TRM68367]MBC9729242.1 holin [Streptomyces sp. TRM68367]